MFKNLIAASLFLLSGCNSKDTTYESLPMGVADIQVNIQNKPLVEDKITNHLVKLTIVPDAESTKTISLVEFLFDQDLSRILEMASISGSTANNGQSDQLAASETISSEKLTISVPDLSIKDTTTLHLNLKVSNAIDLSSTITLEEMKVAFDNKENYQEKINATFRPAIEVRAAGQDNCDTYRIPGMVTTNEGTLIAVYDNRYTRSKDLQEHIDVGMSRSTDGGETWEPMQVIMDQGEWGGKPDYLNGVGDPAVLYDPHTHTIWVAALWMHGFDRDQMGWWVSQPGIEPAQTGQFLLVKSTDDGKTWSDPINITRQIKDPDWQLLLQGPGRGITMSDGTLVFPAQFKADVGEKAIDGGRFTSHSTIIYSKDEGKTWQIGTGAKPNTTEAQVVELSDGSLMLNMRDDRNRKIKDETNGRAVAITTDLGQTWTQHPTSNSALIEPNCMASIIGADIPGNGQQQKVLFFSNPANKYKRVDMTIKASLDEGMTWPAEYQVLLNEEQGFGYSCMTMIDDQHVGILYEGVKNLYFQKIPVDEIIE